MGGETYLAAYLDAPDGATRACAHAYCQQRNASYGSVGAIRKALLSASLASKAADGLRVYEPSSGAVCSGAACPFVAVVECVPAGAPPCPTDASGNIG